MGLRWLIIKDNANITINFKNNKPQGALFSYLPSFEPQTLNDNMLANDLKTKNSYSRNNQRGQGIATSAL